MNRVIIGADCPSGLEHVKMFQKLKVGECYTAAKIPSSKAEALAMANYCRQNKIYLCFWELLIRGGFKFYPNRFKPAEWVPGKKNDPVSLKRDLDEIIDAAGPYYFGRFAVTEIGQTLYGPTEIYATEWRGQNWSNLPRARTMGGAQNDYLKYIGKFIDYERRQVGKGPLIVVDAGMLFKLFCLAGADVLCLEVMPGDPHLMHAAIRGAARAFDKQWGAHIAMSCYGGMHMGELWQRRYRSALYFTYISGSQFIWPESGHLTYDQQNRQRFGFRSSQMKRVRIALRETYQFSRVHTRPAEGPLVRLGVVYGNHDGSPGLWNRCVWGQYRRKVWLEGPAERGWRLPDKFFRKEDWPSETVTGDTDFSGNPPFGQYDVVPVEAALQRLNKYSCLLFLGWNTMTPEIYNKLKRYVRAGGHLIMSLPHLSVEDRRGKPPVLYRQGDFSDLFGVKILGRAEQKIQGIKYIADSVVADYRFPLWRISSDPRFIGNFTPSRLKLTTAKVLCGYHDRYRTTLEDLAAQPFLTENSLGKGAAWLVTAWEYPADEMLLPFTNDLLRVVLNGEQGDIRILSSDRVRYAVYSGRLPISGIKYFVLYLLNVEYHCQADSHVWVKGSVSGVVRTAPSELRVVYLCGDLLLCPSDKMVDLASWHSSDGKEILRLFSVRNQTVEIHNLGKAARKVVINGVQKICQPGRHETIRIKRHVDDSRHTFFKPGFNREPEIGKLPPPLF